MTKPLFLIVLLAIGLQAQTNVGPPALPTGQLTTSVKTNTAITIIQQQYPPSTNIVTIAWNPPTNQVAFFVIWRTTNFYRWEPETLVRPWNSQVTVTQYLPWCAYAVMAYPSNGPSSPLSLPVLSKIH